jgi:hypothetical protein
MVVMTFLARVRLLTVIMMLLGIVASAPAIAQKLAPDGAKDAIIACKAEITGVCAKTVPGQGRIAACLMANRSTASKDCADAISKIEAMAAQ